MVDALVLAINRQQTIQQPNTIQNKNHSSMYATDIIVVNYELQTLCGLIKK